MTLPAEHLGLLYDCGVDGNEGSHIRINTSLNSHNDVSFIKFVAAHEFRHAVQTKYEPWIEMAPENSFYYELDGNFGAKTVYPSFQVPILGESPFIQSQDAASMIFANSYNQYFWHQYLHYRFDSKSSPNSDIIRQFLSRRLNFRQESAISSYNAVLQPFGITFEAAFTDYHVWNLLTGPRLQGNFGYFEHEPQFAYATQPSILPLGNTTIPFSAQPLYPRINSIYSLGARFFESSGASSDRSKLVATVSNAYPVPDALRIIAVSKMGNQLTFTPVPRNANNNNAHAVIPAYDWLGLVVVNTGFVTLREPIQDDDYLSFSIEKTGYFSVPVTFSNESPTANLGGTLSVLNTNLSSIPSGETREMEVAIPFQVKTNHERFVTSQGTFKHQKWNDLLSKTQIETSLSFNVTAKRAKAGFEKIEPVTILSEIDGFANLGQVEFRDPWYVDQQGNQLNSFRNLPAGTAPAGAPGQAPGVFLNMSFTFANAPFYSIGLPAQNNFGAAHGIRQNLLLEWRTNAALTALDGSQRARVQFTAPNATVTAVGKASRLTNTPSQFNSSVQRRIVQTADGAEHLVYESIGRLWYETRDSSNAWVINSTHASGMPFLNLTAAQSPVIDAHHSQPYVLIAYQQGTNLVCTLYKKTGNSYRWHHSRTINTGSTSASLPQVAFSRDQHVMILWRTPSQGYRYEILKLNSEFGTLSFPPSPLFTGTVTGTGSTSTAAVLSGAAELAGFNLPVFDIAWVKNLGGSNQFQQVEWTSMEVRSSGLTTYGPWVVSPSGNYRIDHLSCVSFGPQESRVAWVQNPSGVMSAPQPMSVRTYVRDPWASTITAYDVSVRQVALARTANRNGFYLAWSQFFVFPESQYNTNRNRYILSSSPSVIRNASTVLPNFLLPHQGLSGAVRLQSIPSSTPAFFAESAPLVNGTAKEVSVGSAATVQPSLRVENERGFVEVSLGKATAGERPVSFVGSTDGASSLPAKQQPEKTTFVQSQPFELNPTESLKITVQFTGQGQQFSNLPPKQVLAKLELREAASGALLGTIHHVRPDELDAEGLLHLHFNTPLADAANVVLRLAPAGNLFQNADQLVFVTDTPSGQEPGYSLSQTAKHLDRFVPETFGLKQNYPNPFNPATTIVFDMPYEARVQLDIFDSLGRHIETLVSGSVAAGTH